MYRRIGIIGAHGVGKSSVVEELVGITKIPVIKEIARRYSLNSNINEYKFYQKQILLEQIKEETSLILSNGNFISDRSTIDNLAYFLLKCKEVSIPEERKRYCEIAMYNTLHYSHLFHIPIEIPLQPDGFRFQDKLFQSQINDKIIQLTELFEIDVITITGSLEERVSTVLEMIEWN